MKTKASSKKKTKAAKATFVPTNVTLVLDESGSMSDVHEQTIKAVNEYFRTLAMERPDTVDVSLIKFDTRGLRRLHTDAKLSTLKQPILTIANYQPNAGTPLLDAIGKCINEIPADDKRAQLFVVQTDGYENASHEYTTSAIEKLISEKTKAGWQFVFLGADQNAWATAKHLGFAPGNVAAYSKGATQASFAAFATASNNYRGGGSVRGMSMMADAGFDNADPAAAKPFVVPGSGVPITPVAPIVPPTFTFIGADPGVPDDDEKSEPIL